MSGRIPQDFINQILARADIIDIIQARVKITKRGQNHHGSCPFHQEKTPSFTANQTKQFYYCFGCGAGGNAIGFIMRYEQLDFREAIEYLATHLSLEMPKECDEQSNADFTALFTAMQDANLFYQKQLRQSHVAIDYLKTRGITGEIAKRFNLGFAPDAWDALSHALPKSQHPALATAGMLKQKDSRLYDSFRHRIMFPIKDTRGRIAGFGGRSLDTTPPKYLNSPETPIFHKNFELFGLYEARQINKKLEHLIVVEGYMDVIALHQFGITNTVATLGTAINKYHIQKLLRYTHQITFCFDGDNAGQKAAFKALTTCLPHIRDGIAISLLRLPEQHDPDSLVREIGPERFRQSIHDAPEVAEVLFTTLKNRHNTTNLSGKAQLAKEAMALINTLPTGIFKELLTQRLAQELQLTKDQINQFVDQKPIEQPTQPTTDTANTHLTDLTFQGPLSPIALACSILVQHPTLVQELEPLPRPAIQPTEYPWLEYLAETIKKHCITTTYQLLQYTEKPYHSTLLPLASHELGIPESGLKVELRGVLERLSEQARQNELNALIKRSKSYNLTENEKHRLKTLLHRKNKKLLD